MCIQEIHSSTFNQNITTQGRIACDEVKHTLTYTLKEYTLLPQRKDSVRRDNFYHKIQQTHIVKPYAGGG